MEYNVYLMVDAENDLDRHIRYLLQEKRSKQAAQSVLKDYAETRDKLKIVAGSLQLCKNPRLRSNGYRRINYINHDYFMLYRIKGKDVFVDRIFHFLEDYENKLK